MTGRSGVFMAASTDSGWGIVQSSEDETVEVTLIIFAVLATVVGWIVTMISISQHVNHWNSPDHQKIIVQMLVLVLIWSTFSMLVVLQPLIKPLTQVMMDSYEAYLIVLFMQLMTTYLGGYDFVVETIGTMTEKYRLGPLWLTPSLRGYTVMRFLVYQYIIVKPALSIARCVLYYMDYNERMELRIDVDQVFAAFRYTMLTSLMLAMLGLLMFYRMFYQRLKPYKVGIKFLAMKLFIFLHIMQSFLFTFLEDESGGKEAYFFAAQIEYFCVCIEMALASFLNMSVIFTYREWVNEDDVVKPWIEYFRLDEARLTEWQTSLSNPHLLRQDSLAVEKTRLPSSMHINDEIDEEEEENRKRRNYNTLA